VAPGVGRAVIGVGVSLDAGLVAVVDAGDAGERHLEQGRDPEPALGEAALAVAQAIGGALVVGEGAGIRMATAEEKDTILRAMEERNKSILDGTWKLHWHEFCESQLEKYLKAAGFLDRYTPDEYQRFAHYLDCEAHTDVWREIFPTWNATNELD